MKANTILETIGNTPHIRVQKLFPGAEVWIKSERSNPGGSIKDRIALSMIEAAEADVRCLADGLKDALRFHDVSGGVGKWTGPILPSPANVALPLCWIPTGDGRLRPAWGHS